MCNVYKVQPVYYFLSNHCLPSAGFNLPRRRRIALCTCDLCRFNCDHQSLDFITHWPLMSAGRKIDGQFVITLSPVKSVIRWELVGGPDMLVQLSVSHVMDALLFGKVERIFKRSKRNSHQKPKYLLTFFSFTAISAVP